jgi:hypothetical protein
MDTAHKNKKEMADANGNRRWERRISIDLPVKITRFDPEGNILTERTRIEDVTSVGCRFRTQGEFQRGDIVSICPLAPGEKSLADEQPQLFEIMWAARQANMWSAGARKLEGEKLASVKFPPVNYSSGRTSK